MAAQNGNPNGIAETMGLRVKVEMQAGDSVRFPPRCVNCSREAVDTMRLRMRRERVTRELDAPLCAECKQALQRLSGDEERWLRMGWFFGGIALLVSLILLILLLPSWLSFGPRLAISLMLAGGAAAGVVLYFRRRSREKARPEKLAVQGAARLTDFSWRATTFEFEDEEYGQQFIALNREKLLEAQKV